MGRIVYQKITVFCIQKYALGGMFVALVRCIECSKEISDRAVACPNCGCPLKVRSNNFSKSLNSETTETVYYNPPPHSPPPLNYTQFPSISQPPPRHQVQAKKTPGCFLRGFIYLSVIIVVVFVVVCFAIWLESKRDNGDNNNRSTNIADKLKTNTAVTQNDNYISIEDFKGFHQFHTVKIGTSVDNVIVILGQPTSTMTIDILGIESTTKSWLNYNLFGISSTESVTFIDGYATSVASSTDSFSGITLDELNRISTGMNEKEVFAILGVPFIVSTDEIMGVTSTTVMWLNSNGSSGSVIFINGKVTSTLSMDLS